MTLPLLLTYLSVSVASARNKRYKKGTLTCATWKKIVTQDPKLINLVFFCFKLLKHVNLTATAESFSISMYIQSKNFWIFCHLFKFIYK